MANEFKVKKGLIVHGSGSTVLDIQGSQGQLFSITDDLTGDLFSVSDISGIPILNINSSGAVNIDGTTTLDGITSITSGGTSSPPGVEGLHLMYDTNHAYIKSENNGNTNRPLTFLSSAYTFSVGNATFAGSLDVNGTGNNTFTGNILIANTAPIIQTNSSNNSSGLRINVTGISDSNNNLFRVQRAGTTVFDIKGNSNAIFAGTILSKDITISKSSGDAVLVVEADTDNDNENDNPRIELKQDGGAVYSHYGVNGDLNNTFTGALVNHAYLRTSTGLQLVTNGTTTALTIDTSQKATFAGKVALNSVDISTTATTVLVIDEAIVEKRSLGTGAFATIGDYLPLAGGTLTGNLTVDIDDDGSAPAMTSTFRLKGYEGRGAGIKIQDSVNSATSPSSREWFIGSGYNNSGFNIGYASDGVQSSYNAQSIFNIGTNGNATFTGDLTVEGKVTAQEFHTEFVSASILYESGSTKFGDTSDDVHSFSGSLRVTGSGDHYFTDGNVGIGTDSPDYLLDLYKSTSATETTLQRLWNYVGSDLNQQKTFIDFVFQDANVNEYPQVRIGAEVGQNSNSDTQEKEGSGAFVVYTNNATGVGPGTPTGLAERFRVDYAGNVGIGTPSPGYKLDVNGDVNIPFGTSNGYRINGNRILSQGSGFFEFGALDYKSTYPNISTNSDGTFRIQSNGSTLVTVNQSGNVGIGTTDPQSKLHVAKNGNANGGSIIMGQGGSGTTKWSYLAGTHYNQATGTGNGSGSAGFALIGGLSTATYNQVRIGGGPYEINPATEIQFWTHTATTHNLGGSQRMVINASGNVGIGETTPQVKLQIEGSEMPETTDPASVEDLFTLYRLGSPTVWAGGATLALGRYNTGDGSNPNSRLDFKLKDAAGSNTALPETTVMSMQSDGNVGIGTTSPLATLQVGSITATTMSQVAGEAHIIGVNHDLSDTQMGTLNLTSTSRDSSTNNQGFGSSLTFSQNVSKYVNGYEVVIGGIKTELMYTGNMNKSSIMNFYTHTDTSGLTAKMSIDATGNVGIGTSSPGSKLEVKTSGSNSVIELDNSDTQYTLIQHNALGVTKGFSGYNSGFMLFGGEAGVTTRLQAGGSYAATILTNGNVGIGTTSPNVRLHVQGNDIATRTTTTAQSVLRLVRDVTDSTYTSTKDSAVDFMLSRQQTVNNNLPYTRLDIRLAGTTDSSTPSLDVMSLLHNGNVGIGTTSPSEKLDVNGGIVATGLNFINQSNGYNNPTPGISSFGDVTMDSTVSFFSTGVYVSGDTRGITWTGEHYIITEYVGGTAKFYDNNFELLKGPTNSTITLPTPATGGQDNHHGAAWDGRYLYCVLYGGTGAKIVGYDLDNGTTTATIVVESFMNNPGATYAIEYAEGHLYTVTDGAVSQYKLEGKTITHVQTSGNILSSIEAQAITYDGSYLWITQNGQNVYKVNLNCTLEATITTGYPPNNTGWGWNGQNINAVNYQTGEIYIVRTAAKRIDTEKFLVMGGNAGIGTVDPTAALHVYDQNFGEVKFERSTGYTGLLHFGFPSGLPSIRTSGNFAIKASNTWGADLYINSSGDVGIGTTDPKSKLDVDGGVKIGDDTDTASADKVGTMRYRTGTEYVEVDGTELITNGDFASSSSWTVTSPWTISSGKANYVSGNTAYLVQTGITLTSGVTYRVRFNVSGSSGNGAYIWIGNQAGSINYLSASYKFYADGDFEEIFTMPSNQTALTFYSQTLSSNFSLDNITLIEVTEEDASYADMCMQTGASTYEWINIVRNTY